MVWARAVQLGYLTPAGHPVVVDTLGGKVYYRGMHVSENTRAFRTLGLVRPMESLGVVTVSVLLHRQGWGSRGEVVLRRSRARLYRTRTSHVLIGERWSSIERLRRDVFMEKRMMVVSRPFDSRLPPIVNTPGISPPAGRAPFLLLIHDRDVKAVRSTGVQVHVYATETKEFTDFVLGKLTVEIEFPTEAAATEYARHFPRTTDPRNADSGVKVEVDRSRKVAWTPAMKRALAARAALVVGLSVPMFAIGISILASSVRDSVASGSFFILLGLVNAVFIGGFFRWRIVRRFALELLDYRARWPRAAMERWAPEFRGHAAGFVHLLSEMGVTLDPTSLDLAPMDRFLRDQPSDTFSGTFGWGAAALLGSALLAAIEKDVPFEWRYSDQHRQPLLVFDSVNLSLSPMARIRNIWEAKAPAPLGEFVSSWSRFIQVRSAFQPMSALSALGFFDGNPDDGTAVDAFTKQMEEALGRIPPESRVLGETPFRVRRLAFGFFEILFCEAEIHRPSGPVFVPVIAVPFCTATQELLAQLEGGSRKSRMAREDVFPVRLAGYEMVALGVQARNYLDLGADLAGRGQDLSLRLVAIADRGEVITPRLRASRPETKDFLAPLNPSPEGLPVNAYANYLGRILSVRDLVNPYKNIRLLRILLDITGFRLEVIVREDRCDGVPEVGHFLHGAVWLIADFEAGGPSTTEYIR